MEGFALSLTAAREVRVQPAALSRPRLPAPTASHHTPSLVDTCTHSLWPEAPAGTRGHCQARPGTERTSSVTLSSEVAARSRRHEGGPDGHSAEANRTLARCSPEARPALLGLALLSARQPGALKPPLPATRGASPVTPPTGRGL